MPLDAVTQALLAAFDVRPLRPTERDLRVELDEERSADDGIAADLVRPSQAVYANGMERMREVVRRRYESVHASLADVCDAPETLDEVILLSGGQPTER